ncbi:hypothetical protein HK097_003013 [Rhizophlyctis rosea]|uniref:Inhibitor of growth protein N-terminal histone-binding domain-containing protein n=1 Tax=Rhizophlyctis rosea TaxID=64517 RepID=A0AAD5SF42_9FUNG|nr:hypothetical protein HK097_003013 [Rhizophlyctis rosea]
MADYVEYLEDFLASIENLPKEVIHLFTELKVKDIDLHTIRARLHVKEGRLTKMIKSGNSSSSSSRHRASRGMDPSIGEKASISREVMAFSSSSIASYLQGGTASLSDEALRLYDEIQQDFVDCEGIVADKLNLVEKISQMLDRHLTRLDNDLSRMEEADASTSTPNSSSSYTPVRRDDTRKRTLPTASNSTKRIKSRTSRLWDPIAASRQSPLSRVSSPSIRDMTPDADETPYCICVQPSYGEPVTEM